jgi:hypothetical protein
MFCIQPVHARSSPGRPGTKTPAQEMALANGASVPCLALALALALLCLPPCGPSALSPEGSAMAEAAAAARHLDDALLASIESTAGMHRRALLRSQAGRDFLGSSDQQQALDPGGRRQGLQSHRPYVVAHRGASGLLPEHTAAAYHKAIDDGADFIECDVVVTRDLQLACR